MFYCNSGGKCYYLYSNYIEAFFYSPVLLCRGGLVKSNILADFLNDHFVLFTSVLSEVLCALYVWKGFSEGFFVGTWIVALMNFLYIPTAFFFKQKCFSYFYLAYSTILVFMIAFEKTFLFNNFTALFIVCIVIMIKPKIKYIAMSLYFAAVCVAFSINGESVFHFLIHIVRSIWFVGSVFFVLENQFERKRLVLYEDEVKILEQLCDGKIYQKEVEGFSENTVYRKLKAARERNGNITREQLISLFKKERMGRKSSEKIFRQI